MARITIAQLQHQLAAADLALRTEMETSRLRAEQIEKLKYDLIYAEEMLAACKRELAAYQVVQRPSRVLPTVTPIHTLREGEYVVGEYDKRDGTHWQKIGRWASPKTFVCRHVQVR